MPGAVPIDGDEEALEYHCLDTSQPVVEQLWREETLLARADGSLLPVMRSACRVALDGGAAAGDVIALDIVGRDDAAIGERDRALAAGLGAGDEEAPAAHALGAVRRHAQAQVAVAGAGIARRLRLP